MSSKKGISVTVGRAKNYLSIVAAEAVWVPITST